MPGTQLMNRFSWPARKSLLLHLLGLFSVWLIGRAEPPPATIPQFSLLDQSDRQHQIVFPRSRPLLLIVVDKKGSEIVESWTSPLTASHTGSLDFEIVGDVSPIPSFLRDHYKKKFQKTLTHPVMLDWQGNISGKLLVVRHVPNVYLVSPSGRVVWNSSGAADEQKIKDVTAVITDILKEKP